MERAQIETTIRNLYRRTGAAEFFEEPTVRVASAEDPFFQKFKSVIGPFHWTPQEVLQRKFPEATAKSVIVWVLPVCRKARKTNRDETERPSVEWAAVRSFGEILNEEMRSQLAALLTEAGYPAVAPHLEQREIYPAPGWDVKHFTSSWSERHVAFVAGAGTFGLSAVFGGDDAGTPGGSAPLRRRSLRLVHPLRRLHPPLSGARDRQGVRRPGQTRMRPLLRDARRSRPGGALRLAEPRTRLRPLPDRGAVRIPPPVSFHSGPERETGRSRPARLLTQHGMG